MLIGIGAVKNIKAQDDSVGVGSNLFVTSVAWSHDGLNLASAGVFMPDADSYLGYLTVTNVQSGESIFQLDPTWGGFTSVRWSSDDRFLAVGRFDQTIWVIDLESQRHIATLWGHQATVVTIDWSPDGSKLISGGSTDGDVILWDMKSYQEIKRINRGEVWSVAYSPDGTYIATGGPGGLQILPSSLDVGATYQEQLPYTFFSDLNITALTWNADSSQIVFGTDAFVLPQAEIYVVDRSGALLRTFQTQDTGIFGIDWDSTGKLISTYSINGLVNVRDAVSGAILESYPGSTLYGEQLDFSPFGGRLSFGTDVTVSQLDVNSELTILNQATQIVVPDPSPERLQAIAESCNAPLPVEQAAASADTAAELATFETAVEALPAETIPPACAADLLAVAGAMQGQ
jgi:WD40 repeat protein